MAYQEAWVFRKWSACIYELVACGQLREVMCCENVDVYGLSSSLASSYDRFHLEISK